MSDPNPSPTIHYPKKCGHQPCDCVTSNASSFCSETCGHAHKWSPGARCTCGHAECATRR